MGSPEKEGKILAGLHPLERAVLPVLDKASEFDAIRKACGLQEIEVMRALQWLENKKILTISTKEEESVALDKNGEDALKNGLIEKRFLKVLDNPTPLSDIAKKANLHPQEVNICLGLLKAKKAIHFEEGIVTRTKEGESFLKQETKEEKLLKKLPAVLANLNNDEKKTIEQLKKRKQFVKIQSKKNRSILLTDLGKQLAGKKITLDVEDRLTSDMLKHGSWKDKTFRRYDVTVNVPKIAGGKKHFVNEAITYCKQIWLELGFEEMQGTIINTNFWNLDALFVPQDHPARAMQDTFYLKNPSQGKLPEKFASKVKAVHETGGDTGSKGWQFPWSKKIAAENVLRTHNTVLSSQTLAKIKKEDLPKKFFSVGPVFRNETVDWCHSFEFHQVDGIVIDPDVNFRHLKGYLKEFYKKMGYSDVRLRPAHFPYTEPSVEIDAYDPFHKEWIELGGAGIFRPEVVKPLLGFDVPVLAWGLGLGRILTRYYGIKDIRDLHKNDLKQIREMKAWLL